MSNIQTLNYMEFISADGDGLKTDSLKVAAVHGRRHDNVMALIRQRISESGEWGVLNFKETPYTDEQSGVAYPKFEMTQAGYQFLVGKMTGRKAVEHQIAFINAFEAMAAHIRNQRDGISYRRIAHELAEKDSKRRGTIHGRGLYERKVEKRELKVEEVLLLQEATRPLFLS